MDKPVLKNDIMADGSRLFLQLPQTCPPSRLMWRIIRFGGLPTAFVSDWVTGETWMDSATKAGNSVFTIRMANIGSLLKTANAPKTYCTAWRNILSACPAKTAVDTAASVLASQKLGFLRKPRFQVG